jgi:penicillin-binding protein 1A
MTGEKVWRGPLKNIEYSNDWLEKIEKSFLLEQSIGWQVAIVKEVNQFNAKLRLKKILTE